MNASQNLAIEEVKQKENIVLNLSLNLDVNEFNYNLKSGKQEQLQGIFEFEEGVLNIEMEAHFEGPHNENKERDMTPDGVGVSFKLGI